MDAELAQAGHAAVAAGEADSFGAWVNDGLRHHAARQRRLRALDEFLAAYEGEHGVISDEEIRDASRRTRGRATVVRGSATVGGGRGAA